MNEDLKIPYVDKKIVAYLKDIYSLNYAITTAIEKTSCAEETLGFMKGVQDAIDRLEAITIRQEGD